MLAKFLVLTLVALVAPQILPGIKVKGIGTAALVALAFAVLNILFGWLLSWTLKILTFPLILITFGLFAFVVTMVVNAILLKLASALIETFELESWWSAFGMGFLFAVGARLTEFLT